MKFKAILSAFVFTILASSVFAGARVSSSSSSSFEIEDVSSEAEEAVDDILSDSSSGAQVEYEPLASTGAAVAVRKDRLSNETIKLINTYFALYGTLRNPLKEAEAKKWRDEVSAAQFYYVQKGGVKSIPQELKTLLNRANILYQRTATEREPASEPVKLSPDEKKDICANFPNGLKALYEQTCLK